ncbi:MAG: RHS repeat-associated core domain-containing protein [Acidobacteria bacterium]|nr:RHS repeat-associated core domain-containing protein [Acidobacteriota bacterium]
MSANVVIASPQISYSVADVVSVTAISSKQRLAFWWYTSGWAASSSRFLRENFPFVRSASQQRGWDGKGAPAQPVPKPQPQETQEQRNANVVRVDISPRDATVGAFEQIIFTAVAYDSNNSPVGGVQFDWDGEDEASGEKVNVPEKGKFSSSKEGNYKIKAKLGGREASAKVKVKGVKHVPGEQPIGPGKPISSRDLPVKPKSTSSLQKAKERIAKATSGLPNRGLAGGLAPRGLAASFAPNISKVKTRSAASTMPLVQSGGEDPYGWNSSNYWSADDPGTERGTPPGHAPDGGAGSGNFQFATPVLALDGRGLDINLGLAQNSRLWHKADTEITFDIDRDWPAAGWSLGFGKIVGMGAQNGFMLIDADGTRHAYTGTLNFYQYSQTCVCKTSDGSFIDYKVTGDTPANGGAPITAYAYLPNGTSIYYGAGGSNAIYPMQIIDSNGNMVNISYRNNQGPQIDKITDTLGRVIQFYYDSNNLLVAITAPGFDGTMRTIVRITYDWKNLANLGANYGFIGLTPRVRSDSIPVIKAIYYPANSTGYWFGDTDSYSAYGMLAKVIEQRGMGFSAAPLPADPYQAADPGSITPGTMNRQMVYDYPMSASGLNDSPTYQNGTETWAAMAVPAAVTHYFVQENASPRRVEITRPDGVKTVMLSHNAPGQFNDGQIYQDETYSPQGALLGKSFVNWEQGDYSAPRPTRIETTDERNQKTGKEFGYGPRFNQVTETREYGYGYSYGGANTLLRKTVNFYPNNPNYTDPGSYWRHIFNLVTVSEVYAGDGVTRLARTEYSYDEFTGAAGLQNTPGIVYVGHDLASDPYSGGYNPVTEYRGNVTTIKRYVKAAGPVPADPIIETRHYDITGNLRKVDNSCCEQTTINYTLNTQYAWPESQTRGSATDPTKQNTNGATYDFNTGMVKTSTDANGRISQVTYDSNTLRPLFEYAPTGGYNYHIYDDTGLVVLDFGYKAGDSGGAFASRSDKYLDGHGRVHGEIAYGKAYVLDIVETKYDQLGRVWQQTRPYRHGVDTPQWSTVTYDSLDRPVQTTAPDGSSVYRWYNYSPDPAGSSGQPGQTIRVADGWGRERWARFDALGRLVEVGEASPDGDGTLGSGGMFTTYTYDELDRLTQVSQGSQIRKFQYDSLGRLTHQKLAEREAKLNDLGQHIDVVGGVGYWSDYFSYDTRSNLTLRVDTRGVKTNFIFNDDPLNRLQAVQYDKSGVPSGLVGNIPDAPNVSYAYVTTGDKTRMQNVFVDAGMGNETFSYDAEGRVSNVTQTFTGREDYPLMTSYQWDTADRIEKITYPKQYGAGEIRKEVVPTYDIASRLDSLTFGGTTYASNPVYNATSQVTSLNVGSQVVESYGYDAKTGLLTSQQIVRGVDVFVDLKYNYTLSNDPTNNGAKTGQLTSVTDMKNQTRNRAYEYDKIGRLKKVKGGVNAFYGPDWYQNYSYDHYGNRIGVTKTGSAPQIPLDGLASLSYNTASNRVTSAGFEYDPAGNQTRAVINDSGTQQQYRYDSAGRLAQVLDGSGGLLATHSYGASNERLMSVEGGMTRYYGWDGGRIIAEYEASGVNALQWKTSYVYLGGRLLATTSGSSGAETRFHHPDRLGTRLVTDSSNGEMVTEQMVLPFGTMQPYGGFGGDNSWQHATKSNPSQKRFTSYDRSDATGLDYAMNRFYSAQQGRFTQVDPIGMSAASLSNPQSLNLYAYCGNDPINHIDPEGLFFGKLWRAIKKFFSNIFVKIAVVVALTVISLGLLGPLTFQPVIGTFSLGGGVIASAVGATQLTALGWAAVGLTVLSGVSLPSGFGGWVTFRTPSTFPGGTGVGGVSNFIQNEPKNKIATKTSGWLTIMGKGIRIIGKIVKKIIPGFGVMDSVMDMEVGTSPDDTIDKLEGHVTVYHKGELNRPNKPYFSTGTDRAKVEALKRKGIVHEFRIPKSVYYRWQYDGLIQNIRDTDLATGIVNEEIRFLGKAKTEVMKYKVH